ncbi:hypothetical protein HDC37_002036 [Microbacterium sp. AK009]|uniref:hypothetical protein n=1 Tax=Microbacterium sp. AK009 TaxID=2723068 RepID=UPI0015CB9AC9|nr:hypothetical protein [Microbacterium sp. AK009]NYF17208.1 hypothetical protein [Microbacterium sp. AK009]
MYRADDVVLGRTVAVKLLRPGLDPLRRPTALEVAVAAGDIAGAAPLDMPTAVLPPVVSPSPRSGEESTVVLPSAGASVPPAPSATGTGGHDTGGERPDRGYGLDPHAVRPRGRSGRRTARGSGRTGG